MQDELEMFVATIYGEAGNSSEVAWKSIASVIKNRVGKREWRKLDTVAKVIAGSELDHDLRTTRWNDDAREKGKWELDKSQKSPDVSDAGSYAISLPLFSEIGGQQPDANLSTLERAVLAQEAYVRDVLSGKAPKAERLVPLAHLLWNPPPK